MTVMSLCTGFAKGSLVDRFNSRPDYFGLDPEERKKWAGDFNKLLPLAVEGITVKRIQELVSRKRVFEEELASGLAGLMGINPERASTGFKYLMESEHSFLLMHGKHHSEADTELAKSVESGDIPGVRSALERHASPNGKNGMGESLLVNAIRLGRTEIAALLLASGADPFDNPKADAVWAATAHDNGEILKALLRTPSEKLRSRLPAALTSAIMFSANAEMVEDLLNAGADPNAVRDGTTPLMMACSRGTEFVVEILTAQHPRKQTDWTAMAKALIKAGADVNAKDKNGMTPLLMARATGQKELAELLIEAGADPNAKPGAEFLKGMEALKAAGLKPGAAKPGHLSPQAREILLAELMKQCKK
jgi:ankyrin repeat protein